MEMFDWKMYQGAVQLVQMKETGNSRDEIWKHLEAVRSMHYLSLFSV